MIGTPAPNPDLTVTGDVVDARPRRWRPTPITRVRDRAQRRHGRARPRRTSTSTSAPRWSAPARSARSPPARRRPCRRQHRHPQRRHLPADREGRRDQHGRRAERDEQHLHQPDRARRRARSQLRPGAGRRAGRRATRPPATPSTFSVAHPQPGHDRLGRRRARHHADRARRDRRDRAHADRRRSPASIDAGATSAPVNLGTWTAANGRYTVRVVHRRRRQRAAGQAGQQHQPTSRCSSAAARTCRTTCTRPRTAVLGGGAGVVGPEPDDRRPRR